MRLTPARSSSTAEPCRSAARATRSRPASGWSTRSSRSATTCRSPRTSAWRAAARGAASSIGGDAARAPRGCSRRSARRIDVRTPVGELTIGAAADACRSPPPSGAARASSSSTSRPAASSQHEAEPLYALIGRLRARGVTCIYVTHRMAEIFRLCDTDHRAARRPPRGHAAGRGARRGELVQMMIGRPLDRLLPRARRAARGRRSCCASNGLSSPAGSGRLILDPGGRSPRARGAGRRRPIRGRAGDLRPRSAATGRVPVRGGRCRSRSPARRDARRHRPRAGRSQAPGARAVDDRAQQRDPARCSSALARGTFVRRPRSARWRAAISTSCACAPPRRDAPAAGLSGGNQQKSCWRSGSRRTARS